ncbi:MAG: helix-turn-helix domain-containing protein [Desulfobacula sp.]|nr:helix-turn-helix domain-containing protein [Desulfobacula sp.]
MADEKNIITIEETAQYLQKSTSWVYKNWKILGGRKLGGSLFFPAKEDLYEYLFGKRERVEVRLHPERNQAHGSMVHDKERSTVSRGRKKKGGVEPGLADNRPNPNRHGILGIGE